jgi:hypothetical protein
MFRMNGTTGPKASAPAAFAARGLAPIPTGC